MRARDFLNEAAQVLTQPIVTNDRQLQKLLWYVLKHKIVDASTAKIVDDQWRPAADPKKSRHIGQSAGDILNLLKGQTGWALQVYLPTNHFIISTDHVYTADSAADIGNRIGIYRLINEYQYPNTNLPAYNIDGMLGINDMIDDHKFNKLMTELYEKLINRAYQQEYDWYEDNPEFYLKGFFNQIEQYRESFIADIAEDMLQDLRAKYPPDVVTEPPGIKSFGEKLYPYYEKNPHVVNAALRRSTLKTLDWWFKNIYNEMNS